MNDTVKGITPEDDREHIISLYGHVKGVEREIELIKTNHLKHLDDKITHVHQDVEALSFSSRSRSPSSLGACACHRSSRIWSL